MVSWQCPHCNYSFHSAWTKEDHRFIKCEWCNREFDNPHYSRIELTKEDVQAILCKIGDIYCTDCPSFGDGEFYDTCDIIKGRREAVIGRLKGAVGIGVS